MWKFSTRVALAWVAVIVACGGEKTTTVDVPDSGESRRTPGCVPGQSIACTGTNGCTGAQVCANEGDHYLPCECAGVVDASVPDAEPVDAGVDAAAIYGARCNAPDTAPLTYTTVGDAANALAGQWWLCFGAAEFYYPVEFTADGHWYKLTQVGSTFQRNLGPETSGLYTIKSLENGGTYFAMTWNTATFTCCDYPFNGVIQSGGKMRLGGGDYIKLP